MNIFAKATKQKLRFDTVRGRICIEDVWQMPLSSKDGFDLDSLAKQVSKDVKAVSEDSFVSTTVNPAKADHTLRFELLMAVIETRLEERAAAQSASQTAQRRQQILGIIAEKRVEEQRALPVDELLKELASLDK